MLQMPDFPQNVDVLIAAHHGSNSSSMKAFVNYVNPKHVIFSSGYKNRFGHPHPKVLARYEQVGSNIWQTAKEGQITVVFDDDDGWQVFSYRQTRIRLWHDNSS